MVVTFDFDDTLTRQRLDDDYGIRYMGPNQSTIARLKEHVRDNNVVYVVTSRNEHNEGNLPELDEYGRVLAHSVQEFLNEQGLLNYVENVYFTNGNLKSGVLKHLGSDVHYDDDAEELGALHVDTEGIRVDHETGAILGGV